MIIRPYRRSLGTVRKFRPTDKAIPYGARDKEQMWGRFADMIRDKFGDGGATPEVVYRDLTGPLGLTADTTMELLTAARDGGYLATSKVASSDEEVE